MLIHRFYALVTDVDLTTCHAGENERIVKILFLSFAYRETFYGFLWVVCFDNCVIHLRLILISSNV